VAPLPARLPKKLELVALVAFRPAEGPPKRLLFRVALSGNDPIFIALVANVWVDEKLLSTLILA
jgi:hypothetical protein